MNCDAKEEREGEGEGYKRAMVMARARGGSGYDDEVSDADCCRVAIGRRRRGAVGESRRTKAADQDVVLVEMRRGRGTTRILLRVASAE